METLDKPIQLSEEVSYPDGFNVVIVEGTGDETRIEEFAKIRLVVTPTTLKSNGRDLFTCTVYLTEPNATDRFTCIDRLEHTNANDRTSLSVQFYIKSLDNSSVPTVADPANDPVYQAACAAERFGIWEDLSGDEEGEVYGHPLFLDTSKGNGKGYESNNIYVIDDRPTRLVPTIVKYNGGRVIRFSTGGIDLDGNGEVDEDEADNLTGDFCNSTNTIKTDEVLIDGNTSHTATRSHYLLPELGGRGYITIHAEYENVEATQRMWVDVGDLENCSLSITAEPPSIAIGASSQITAVLSDGNGWPLTGEIVYFTLNGPGRLSKSSDLTAAVDNYEQELESATQTTFSTEYPITQLIRVEQADVIDIPDWNGGNPVTVFSAADWSWDGSDVTIKNSALQFPWNNYPIKVTYNYGGVAKTTFYGTQASDSILVTAVVSENNNANCTITVTRDDIASNLQLNADPTAIPKLGTSTIEATYVDDDGNPETGTIKLNISKGGGTVGNILLKPFRLTDQEGTSNSRWEVGVGKPITSVQGVYYPDRGTSYGVDSFEGTTIYLSRQLPSSGLQCIVDYTSGGTGTAEYTARDLDEYVDIFGVAPDGSRAAAPRITVGEPGAPHPISVNFNEVSENPVNVGHTSIIYFDMQLDDGGPPPEGNYRIAIFQLVNSPGFLCAGELTAPPTNMFGNVLGSSSLTVEATLQDGVVKGSFTYVAPKNQEAKVIISGKYKDAGDADLYKGEESQQELDVKYFKKTYVTKKIQVGSINVSVNPKTGDYDVSNGVTIIDMGAGEDTDEFGAVEYNPVDYPMRILWRCLKTADPGYSLSDKDISSSGAAAFLNAADNSQSYDFNISIPWSSDENRQAYVIEVTAKNDPTQPIDKATVTILGKSATTDATGKATFYSLPVGTHAIYIKEANYKWNREPAVGGTGEDYDVDTTNDTITVVAYSDRPYFLKDMQVTIECYIIEAKAVYEPPEEVQA